MRTHFAPGKLPFVVSAWPWLLLRSAFNACLAVVRWSLPGLGQRSKWLGTRQEGGEPSPTKRGIVRSQPLLGKDISASRLLHIPSSAAEDTDSSPAADQTPTDDSARGFVACLRCDPDFVIREADPAALDLLRFEREELIGKSILELMSPAVADVHKHIFRNLKSLKPEAVCEVGKQLLMSSMSRCREFAVLDSKKEALVCSVSVALNRDCSSTVQLRNTEGKILNTVPLGFGKFINDKPGMYVQNFDDCMCVMMDVAGSTRFSQSKPPALMAELFHRMYVEANAVVLQEAFPFAYIHEIVGDSLLLLVNAGFMVQYPARAAAIGSMVSMQVQRRLDAMLASYSMEMYTRVGIAIGAVSAGVVDGRTFRIFGSTVHLSQRLESLCPRGKVACSLEFLEWLRKEDAVEGIKVETHEAEAKGFGCVSFATLQRSVLS